MKEILRETIETIVDAAFRMREEDKRFYAELSAESDRGAAILAAEYFDQRLRKAIEAKLSALDDELWKRMKNDKTDLRKRFVGSTFSTRINIAYVLGLYDHETRERLNDVRYIRNSFAHPSMSTPLDFDTRCLVVKCLKFPLKTPPDPDSSRNRYVRYLEEVGDSVWDALMELQERAGSA